MHGENIQPTHGCELFLLPDKPHPPLLLVIQSTMPMNFSLTFGVHASISLKQIYYRIKGWHVLLLLWSPVTLHITPLSKESPPLKIIRMSQMTSHWFCTHYFGDMQASLCVNFFAWRMDSHHLYPWSHMWFLDDHHDPKTAGSKFYGHDHLHRPFSGLFPKP